MAVINRKKNMDKLSINSVEDLLTIFDSGYPVDIENIVRNYNIQILFDSNLKNEESGYIKKKDGKWIIGVNPKHHKNRQRFTIAHELGHFFLHTGYLNKVEIHSDTLLFRNGEINLKEIEANDFASKLLMPENEFRNQVQNGMTSIEELAKYFGVSTLAIRYKAKNLDF